MTKSILDRLPIGLIIATVFLTPLFFLPGTPETLEFNKQILIICGSFIALLAILAFSLSRGHISLPRSFAHIAVFLVLFSSFISAIFSQNSNLSFLGFGSGSQEAFLSVLAFVLLYFSILIYFTRRWSLWLLRTLVFSGVLVGLTEIIAISGILKNILSVDFSTVGAPGSTGLFMAATLAISIGGAMFWIGKWQKIATVSSIFIFVAAILIFQDLIWVIFSFSATFMLLLHLLHLRKASSSVLSTVFLGTFIGLSLGFFLFAPLAGLVFSSVEVLPSLSLSLDIARRSLLESPLFGIGQGNWVNAYNLYFPEELNQGSFWNVSFIQSGSKFLTLVVTGGILSFLSWAMFVILVGVGGFKNGYFAYQGFTKNLFSLRSFAFFLRKKQISESNQGLNISVSPNTDIFFPVFFAWFLLVLGQFFMGSNITLEVLFWILSAILLLPLKKENFNVDSGDVQDKDESSFFKFTKDSLAFQIIALTVAILIIASVSVGLIFAKRYAGAIAYNNASKEFSKNNRKGVLDSLKFAVRMEPVNNFYLISLSDVALQAFIEESSSREELNQEKLDRVNEYSALALASAQTLTIKEPQKADNWYLLAKIYVTMNQSGVIEASEKAFEAFAKAIELSPKNPLFVTELGNAQFYSWNSADVNDISDKEKDKLFSEAEKSFKKAIELKKDYAPAHFGLGVLYYREQNYIDAEKEFRAIISYVPASSDAHYLLGLTLDAKGNKPEAIYEFEIVAQLNPDNAEVKKIIENLKVGKAALDGIGSDIPQPNVSE